MKTHLKCAFCGAPIIAIHETEWATGVIDPNGSVPEKESGVSYVCEKGHEDREAEDAPDYGE